MKNSTLLHCAHCDCTVANCKLAILSLNHECHCQFLFWDSTQNEEETKLKRMMDNCRYCNFKQFFLLLNCAHWWQAEFLTEDLKPKEIKANIETSWFKNNFLIESQYIFITEHSSKNRLWSWSVCMSAFLHIHKSERGPRQLVEIALLDVFLVLKIFETKWTVIWVLSCHYKFWVLRVLFRWLEVPSLKWRNSLIGAIAAMF